jgi:hypothetical protein
MFKSIKRLAIVVTVIAGAIIPSAAYARPILPDRQPYTVTPSMLQPAAPAPAHEVAATSGPGFSWHDAGFGAAGMLVLVALGTGATLAVRRGAILS